MPDEVTKGLGDFLDYVFADTECHVYMATLEGGDNSTFKQLMVPWPKGRDAIVRRAITENAKGRDVYYCPSPFAVQDDGSTPRPIKENALGSRVLFVDFDKQTAPKEWSTVAEATGIPEPTMRLQSSVPGNEHTYWNIGELKSPEWVEERNRSLAFRLGADRSGWDINQLLRLPYTTNYGWRKPGEHKDWYKGNPAQVQIIHHADSSVDSQAFEPLTAEKEALSKIKLGTIPTVQEALSLGNSTKGILDQFNMTKDEATASSPDKRSGALMRLAFMLAEVGGFTDEQMYSIIEDADTRWEKYVNRSKAGREKILLDTIARARAKHGYVSPDVDEFSGLTSTSGPADGEQKIVYNFQEFLDTEIKVDWILEGQIADKSLGVITGQPGIGKTQLGINLAIHLALGQDFLGSKFALPGGLKVLMLSLEMHHAHLDTFVRKISQDYVGSFRQLEKNFFLAPIGEDIPLNTTAGQNALDNFMSQYRPDVLFIDSLQAMTSDSLSDETKTKELMKTLRKYTNKYECTVYMIHHDRKMPGNKRDRTDVELSAMFGSQFIAANLDWALSLNYAMEDDEPGTLNLVEVKNRLAELHPVRKLTRSRNLTFSEQKVTGLAASVEAPIANI